MQLSKSKATLDELLSEEEDIRSSIKAQQRQLKTVVSTRKQFQKLAASLPKQKPRRVAKKSATAAAA